MNEGAHTALPRASVLVCSRERARMLTDTVRSVLAGSVLPAEIVIVDQSAVPNSDVATMGTVRGCPVRYVHSQTSGLSRARNVALRAARSPVAVLIDDDMFVEEHWLGELLGGLVGGGGDCVVATGRVLAAPPEGDATVIPPAALVERDAPAIYRGMQPGDVVPGANVALPCELALWLGGYDERLGAGTRFGAADDNDMGHRLLRAGCEVRHIPAAVTYHRAWRSRSEIMRLRWRYGRGKGAFYAKYVQLGDRHIRHRAAVDARRRVGRALSAVPRAPRTTVIELITLTAMFVGALDWMLTQRRPTEPAAA